MTKKQRSSQRLKDFDYANARNYFITVCTQHRNPLFGSIQNKTMILNDAGRMILQTWEEIPDHYPGIGIDVAQVMPDHIHGIVVITPDDDDDDGVGAGPRARPSLNNLSLSDIMERFKSLTTIRYIHGVKQLGWPPFPKTLWQRNYHDRIVRNAQELDRIRIYIRNNPREWESGEREFEP